MNQFEELFRGQFGKVVEPDGSEHQLGKFLVKCIFDTEEVFDDFFVDGKSTDFPTSIDMDVDFSTMELVCFKSDGYSKVGCYFCLGLLNGEVVLIDVDDGSISGQ